MALKLNYIYVFLCLGLLVIATVGAPVVVTIQQVANLSHSGAMQSGWSPTNLTILWLISITLMCWWFRYIYQLVKTELTDKGITQPTLFGSAAVSWGPELLIRKQGFGFCLTDGSSKVVVAPYAYKDPAKVIDFIYKKAKIV